MNTAQKKFVSRPILVTGCSSGIGYCVAHGLKKRGYRVFASARKMEDVQRLQEEGLEALHLDLQDSQSIQTALAQLLAQTEGRLFGLFNNGGYAQPGAVEDLSRTALRQQFETNVLGYHELITQVLPIMRQQGEGRIIQNSSLLGLIVLPYRGAYNASKFALEGLSSTLRLELVGSGIYVSLIEPGPIQSRFRANAYQMFKQHINVEASAHQQLYQRFKQRLLAEKPPSLFTLPPEAVLTRVIQALEAPRPQAHYYVTLPTYLLVTLKRLLPQPMLDWLLLRSGG